MTKSYQHYASDQRQRPGMSWRVIAVLAITFIVVIVIWYYWYYSACDCPEKCLSNTDCGAGKVCINGQCVAAAQKTTDSKCDSDADCNPRGGNAEVCQASIIDGVRRCLIKDGFYCTLSTQCASGYCLDNTCTPLFGKSTQPVMTKTYIVDKCGKIMSKEGTNVDSLSSELLTLVAELQGVITQGVVSWKDTPVAGAGTLNNLVLTGVVGGSGVLESTSRRLMFNYNLGRMAGLFDEYTISTESIEISGDDPQTVVMNMIMNSRDVRLDINVDVTDVSSNSMIGRCRPEDDPALAEVITRLTVRFTITGCGTGSGRITRIEVTRFEPSIVSINDSSGNVYRCAVGSATAQSILEIGSTAPVITASLTATTPLSGGHTMLSDFNNDLTAVSRVAQNLITRDVDIPVTCRTVPSGACIPAVGITGTVYSMPTTTNLSYQECKSACELMSACQGIVYRDSVASCTLSRVSPTSLPTTVELGSTVWSKTNVDELTNRVATISPQDLLAFQGMIETSSAAECMATRSRLSADGASYNFDTQQCQLYSRVTSQTLGATGTDRCSGRSGLNVFNVS